MISASHSTHEPPRKVSILRLNSVPSWRSLGYGVTLDVIFIIAVIVIMAAMSVPKKVGVPALARA